MSNILLEQFVVGPLAVNCYLLGCSRSQKMAVIDPGGEVNRIWQRVTEIGYSLEYIINTHGHLDHITGNQELKQKSQASIIAHPDDLILMTRRDNFLAAMIPEAKPSPPPDQPVHDGDIIELGKLSLKVIHTPGHSPGGICLLVGDILFTGDTLFADGIGRTDFPGGNYHQLIASIKNKLYVLDEQLRILPGHGDESTLGREKHWNPFVRV
ncbi:MAG: MBL fold metallo-hydrolase [bacterium]